MATWSSQGRQGFCLWCLVPTWSAPQRGSAGRAGCPWRPPWTCRTSRSSRSSTSRWRRGHSLPTRHIAHNLQQSCALEQDEQQKRELGRGYIYEWPAALWTRAGQVNLAARHPWIYFLNEEQMKTWFEKYVHRKWGGCSEVSSFKRKMKLSLFILENTVPTAPNSFSCKLSTYWLI